MLILSKSLAQNPWLFNGKIQIKCQKCYDNNGYKLFEYLLSVLLSEWKVFNKYYKINKDSNLANILK